MLRLLFALSLVPGFRSQHPRQLSGICDRSDVSIVNRGFKANGTVALSLVAANSGSQDEC